MKEYVTTANDWSGVLAYTIISVKTRRKLAKVWAQSKKEAHALYFQHNPTSCTTIEVHKEKI